MSGRVSIPAYLCVDCRADARYWSNACRHDAYRKRKLGAA
jgi:hypothetical protein